MSAPRYLVVLLLGVILARSSGGLVEIGGAGFELMLILGLYPTMMYGFREGYVHAWLAGFAVDLQSAGTVVPACLAYLLVAYGVSVVRGLLELRGNPATQAMTVAAAGLAVGNLGAIAVRLTAGSYTMPLLGEAMAAAAYGGLVAPVVFLFLDRLPLAHRQRDGEKMPLVAAQRRPPGSRPPGSRPPRVGAGARA